MATPSARDQPMFPPTIADGMLATLVGFGIHDVIDRGRQVGGGQFSVKLGPVVMGRQAVVELELPDRRGAPTTEILVFFEERKKIRRVVAFDREDLLREHEHVLKRLEPPRVVSIRAYEMPMPPDQNDPQYRNVTGLEIPLRKDRPPVLRPLFIAIDEATDAVVLAIGNLGDRIEYTPDARPSYKPAWYQSLAVMSA